MNIKLWGKVFTWVIRGAEVEKVWGVTGDFGRVDKWITTLVQSCEIVEGKAQTPGCIRRPVLYPASPGQPFTFGIEKLLLMDPLSHHYQYTILGGTLPGFSKMQGYISSFKLSSLNSHSHHDDETPKEYATLLQWNFTCDPVSTLSEEESHKTAFSLYEAGINDLQKHLALPDGSITFLD